MTAKIISQKAFNDMVKENMEEFEMTEEESVKDVLEQLKAQGVSTKTLVLSASKAEEIINRVKKLPTLSDDKLSKELEEISQLIEGNLGMQMLAAKEGLYNHLIDMLSQEKHKENVLYTLIKLMDGYPDLLDTEGMTLLIKSLLDPSTKLSALKWLKVCLKMHEKNREELIKLNVIDKLKEIIENDGENSEILTETNNAIIVFLSDDDIRVSCGNTHEYARKFANELLDSLIFLLSRHIENKSTLEGLLQVLTSLTVRNEYCIQMWEKDGVQHLLNILQAYADKENICREGLMLLKNVAGSDEVRAKLASTRFAELVVDCLDRHYLSSNFAASAFLCIAALTLRCPANSLALNEANGPEIFVKALAHWQNNSTLRRYACTAIRNQTSRCPELRPIYHSLEAGEILQMFTLKDGDLEYEAKRVLIDLGYDVSLNEPWKGQGHQVTN